MCQGWSQALKRRLRDKPWVRPMRLARLGLEARRNGHTDWARILGREREKWADTLRGGQAPRVLIATSMGVHFDATRIDGLLAVALALRGASVEHLYCDVLLPACMAAEKSWYPDLARFGRRGSRDDICKHCFSPVLEAVSPLGQPIHRMGGLISDAEREEVARWAEHADISRIKELTTEGVGVGEHALSGTLRFLARGTLEPGVEPVLKAYLKAARMTQLAVTRLIQGKRFDVAVIHHGIYVPQGVIAEVMQRAGIRVVTWNPAYRKGCFIFSHDDTYHRTMIDEPMEVWEALTLTPEQDKGLTDYLYSRRQGVHDWITFNRRPDSDFKGFARKRGIDMEKPLVGLLTNVFWDAQIHYPANSFGTMRDWLVRTVRYFARRQDLQLIIRAHPAEVTGALPARETVVSMLQEDIGELPSNVFLVAADEPISTYSILEHCCACLIYATKAGIEVLTMGVPLIVTGEAWVRGKGMCGEASDEVGYFALLDRLPEPPIDMAGVVERARKYAYHFFFRRMIPLAAVQPIAGWPSCRIHVPSLGALQPGVDPGLDVICEGITNGAPFIYPAETLTSGPTPAASRPHDLNVDT